MSYWRCWAALNLLYCYMLQIEFFRWQMSTWLWQTTQLLWECRGLPVRHPKRRSCGFVIFLMRILAAVCMGAGSAWSGTTVGRCEIVQAFSVVPKLGNLPPWILKIARSNISERHLYLKKWMEHDPDFFVFFFWGCFVLATLNLSVLHGHRKKLFQPFS